MLTDRKARSITKPGRYRHDPNLYLFVREPARKVWTLRYVSPDGRSREMQLGRFPDLGCAEAREVAARYRRVLDDGRDPIEARHVERAQRQESDRRATATLETLARQHHADHAHAWKNSKHAEQWLSSLERHVFPLLGSRSPQAITADDLLSILLPLNQQAHETAKRVRQRLEAVFADAKLRGLCNGNPAADIRRRLKAPATRRHFAAMLYRDVPAFVARLRDSSAAPSVRLALEFLILTAARTNEVRLMRWSDVDTERAVWTVPAERMKKGAEHRVPLSGRALEILEAMRPMMHAADGSSYVFPGQRRERPLSDMAMLAALQRMGESATVHGFRAAFRTWGAEQTRFRGEVLEAALAHKEKDAVKAAYSRAEHWDDRVRLAGAWERFVTARPATVVPMRAAS